jgi:pyruvate kinase
VLLHCLQVVEVVNECDVVCVARNDALLDGLLTVFHVERSSDELLNLQNDLPLLSDYDKECIISLAVVSLGAGEGGGV